MLVNSRKADYRRMTVGLILLSALVLSSCGKKAEDSAANNTSNEPSAGVNSTTATKDSTAKTTSKSSTSAKTKLSAEAQKLGVKPTGTTCPTNAPIKGNLNNKGNKIYHEAKAKGYQQVKPEICFADAATAKKAGFTAPKAGKTP